MLLYKRYFSQRILHETIALSKITKNRALQHSRGAPAAADCADPAVAGVRTTGLWHGAGNPTGQAGLDSGAYIPLSPLSARAHSGLRAAARPAVRALSHHHRPGDHRPRGTGGGRG